MKYLKSFNENMALAKSIIAKKMDGFEKLKTLLKSNLGYIGKFTDYLMNENIPLNELENLYKDLVDLKNKQKPIDISSLKYEEVIDKIQDSRNDLSINALIQQFPSEQKELARTILKNNQDRWSYQTNYNLFLQASKKENKESLISKISRYKTTEALLNALKLFGKASFNDKEEIKGYLKASKSQLVFENENVMVVKVNNIEDIKKLGSDTSWCILGTAMWNRYTKDRYQFIIYDFRRDEWDPLFKIGFTLNKDFTVYTAHNILDGYCLNQLMDLTSEQEIKFSNLIPQSERVEITEKMIDGVNSRTTLTTLQTYADNVSRELLLKFLKKVVSTTSNLTDNRRKIIVQLINNYFVDAEYVTNKDLAKIDEKILKFSLGHKCLAGKRVTENPNFNSSDLNPNITIKMLEEDHWSEEKLISAFSTVSLINNLIIIPGAHWADAKELKFSDSWDKEKISKVSDKLNQIWSSGKWKKLNEYSRESICCNYVVLNYLLDRKNLVNPEVISSLSANYKVQFAYVLKMPIDLSTGNNFRDINNWSIPLIIKKDYPNTIIYLEKKPIVALVDKLIDNQLYFKINKRNIDTFVTRINGLPASPGKEKLLNTIYKVKTKSRVGDKITSDDGKITIELF